MNFPTETPTAPPPSGVIQTPWDHRVNYKSGKVQASLAEIATPENIKPGFTYYDSDQRQQYEIAEFSAVVVAVLASAQGVEKDGDRYNNWFSNYVYDTRTEALEVRVYGIDRPVLTGIYSDIKNDFPQGVGYTQALVVYSPEYKKTYVINLTVGLQNHLILAIAKATNTQPKKVRLYGLCDLSTQYWGFKFTGKFIKVTKEGDLWNGTGEMYFMPECSAFVINQKPETESWFEIFNQKSAEVSEYVLSNQARIQKYAPSAPLPQEADMPRTSSHAQVAPASTDANFPQLDVQSPASHEDDLPF